MSTNQSPEYFAAEERYRQADTTEKKVSCLEEMMRIFKKHKGSEKMLSELRTRLKKLLAKLEKDKAQKKGKGFQVAVKKEGVAQVVILGVTNSGKSYLLSKLTNAKPLISDVEYTTKLPEQGILELNGMKIQIVEIPAICHDFVNKENGRALSSIIRNSDLIIILLRNKPKEELNLIVNELDKANVRLNEHIEESYVVKSIRTIIILNNVGNLKTRNFNVYHLTDNLPLFIWKNLDKLFVYTKTPKKEKDWPPVALNTNSTVKDLALLVHKDFIRKFKFAKIWGSSKFPGQTVGLDYVLKEGDVVEFHIEK